MNCSIISNKQRAKGFWRDSGEKDTILAESFEFIPFYGMMERRARRWIEVQTMTTWVYHVDTDNQIRCFIPQDYVQPVSS